MRLWEPPNEKLANFQRLPEPHPYFVVIFKGDQVYGNGEQQRKL